MYDKDDPRSSLATATAPRPDSGDAIGVPQYLDLRDTPVVRAQNVILAHTRAHEGEELDNGELDGELAVIVTGDSPAFTIVTADDVNEVRAPGLVVVPPGRSRIHVPGDGSLVRLVEATEPAWRDRPANAAVYAQAHPRVSPLRRWPLPRGPQRVRYYPLSAVPEEPGRFGRIFRTRSFMVNFLPEQDGPRDPHRLSPHHHDDFEQLSLAVQGEYVHHIRTPWLTDRTRWRDDDHVRIGSPSVTIIPPPTVHTSEASGPEVNQLIDIFSPPRLDFSAKPGWVLNADDYPMP